MFFNSHFKKHQFKHRKYNHFGKSVDIEAAIEQEPNAEEGWCEVTLVH